MTARRATRGGRGGVSGRSEYDFLGWYSVVLPRSFTAAASQPLRPTPSSSRNSARGGGRWGFGIAPGQPRRTSGRGGSGPRRPPPGGAERPGAEVADDEGRGRVAVEDEPLVQGLEEPGRRRG